YMHPPQPGAPAQVPPRAAAEQPPPHQAPMVQPPPPPPPPPAQAPLPGQASGWQQEKAAEALAKHGGIGEAAPQQSGGVRSPYTELRMFVSQKRKLVELTNEYAVFGVDGNQIG